MSNEMQSFEADTENALGRAAVHKRLTDQPVFDSPRARDCSRGVSADNAEPTPGRSILVCILVEPISLVLIDYHSTVWYDI